MANNPLHSQFDGFSTEYKALLGGILIELSKENNYKNIDKLIKQAFRKANFLEKFRNMIVKYIKKFFPGKTTSWILGQRVGSFTLSQTVWKNTVATQLIIKNELKKMLTAEVAWNKLAGSIFKLRLDNAALPAYMKKMLRVSRSFGVPNDVYEKQLKRTLKQIRKLNNLGMGQNARLNKAYKNLALITKDSSNRQVRRAIRRALLAKSKYVAERLARTEMAKAYGKTLFENFEEQKVPAYKSTLSSRHKIFDICDYWAKTNQYGLGPGVFPANQTPGFPYHPNCMCSLTPIFVIKEKPKYNPKEGKKFLEKGDNKRMLLKRDQSDFKKTKHPEELIPQYNKPHDV